MNLRHVLKFLLYPGIFLLCLMIIFNFSLLRYGFSQAMGFYKVWRDCVPLSTLAKSPVYKTKYKLIQKAFAFAAQQGLDTTDAYQWFLPQHAEHRLVVVGASARHKILSYTWNFPFLGAVPYKGFYERKLLLKELEMLKAEGFDTDTSVVEAWSALGWMSEILNEETLKKDDTTLTCILFHELTHRRLYLYDAPALNENLAQACGEYLNIQFWGLPKKREDAEQTFASMMYRFIKHGNRLYARVRNTEALNKTRFLLIKQSVDSVYANKYLGKKAKARIAGRIGQSVNAFFSGYANYYSCQDSLMIVIEDSCKGNLPVFFARF